MPKRTLSAWVWTLVLIGLCLLPAAWTPEGGNFPAAEVVPHLDKLVHATFFAVFGLLWMRVATRERPALWVFSIGALLAVGTELAQRLPVVARDPDPLDGLSDMVGLLCGIVAYARLPKPVPARLRTAAESGQV
jgi:hypothetical protein